MCAGIWSTKERQAWTVAAYARRFALIANREPLASDERADRWAAALDSDRMHLFDAASTAGANELDRLCAAAVLVISDGETEHVDAVLELLSSIEPERIAGIYFALQPSRRRRVLGNPLWSFWAKRIEPYYDEAASRLEGMLASTGASPIAYDLARLDVALGRG